MMKKIIGLLIISTAMILSGCNEDRASTDGDETPEVDGYRYPTEEVEKAFAEASFTATLPERLPIPVAYVVYDHYFLDGVEILDLSFYSDQNDLLTIQIKDGETTACATLETVQVNGVQEACFYQSDFVQQLVVIDQPLIYQIEYRKGMREDDAEELYPIEQRHLVEISEAIRS